MNLPHDALCMRIHHNGVAPRHGVTPGQLVATAAKTARLWDCHSAIGKGSMATCRLVILASEIDSVSQRMHCKNLLRVLHLG